MTRAKTPPNLDDVDTLDDFTRAYVACALWSTNDNSTPSGGDPLDANYDEGDVAPECARQMIDDCRKFQVDQRELLERAYAFDRRYNAGNAGHDFWLTRCGHGAGFLDRGLGDVGDKLSDACEPYDNIDLYVGDDGKIYG